MIVVLPVCHKDADAALRNLQWIRELDGQSPFHCVVSHDTSFDATEVKAKAELAFANVTENVYPVPREGPWPIPQNAAFHSAAIHALIQLKQPWFWWEQDAVFVKANGLADLDKAYQASGKPFMGSLCTRNNIQHMTGVAVYPYTLARQFPRVMACGRIPFDLAGGKEVLSKAFITDLIQVNNNGPDLIWNTHVDLQQLRPETVLFHRCKDASLLELLQRKPPVPLQARAVGLLSRGIKAITRKQKPRPGIKARRIIHVVERHPTSQERIKRAVKSWKSLYLSGEVEPFEVWKYPRSSLDIGDKRCLPYLKDLLLLSMQEAGSDDIIMLTNGDNILHPELPALIQETLAKVPCIGSYRLNVKEPPDLSQSPAALAENGWADFGRDLFAFRKSWLLEKWNSIPDFFIGEWEWDLVLALMVRKQNGVVINSKRDLSTRDPASELPLGYVMHEVHDRPWLKTVYATSPSKRHNLDLANAWYLQNGMPDAQIHP